ncbi:MAG TPA: hypothetical protein VMW36_08745 [Patescibacteria group bacterium]|nr:hypothetical protein [Patescibacteria group bacterium]
MKMTVSELAAKLGTENSDTRGLLNVLIVKGQASKTDEIRPPRGNGKGKGSTVYEVSEVVTLTI